MNVLRVISSMDPASGGPCQGIRNSIPALEKLGVRNEVVCLDNPLAGFMGKDNFPIHAVGPSKGPWAHSDKLLPWLLENFGRFDVVIIHGLWLYSSHAVAKASRIYRRKHGGKVPRIYVMPHGMLDPYFQRAAGRKIKAIRNWAYWKMIEARVVNNADGVLFTCQAELELAREPFKPYHPKKELNVGYGVPQPPGFHPQMGEAFTNKCIGLNGRPYLLFLSRIHDKKGADILLGAYNEINAGIGANYCLVIAGPGLDTVYGLALQKMVEDNPFLKQNVFFPGMLGGDAKWGAFYGCEAFVLPSHQENFGISVVEAMACKKPVLISNQVNIWREIVEGNGGLVADDTLAGTKKMLNQWYQLPLDKKQWMGINANTVYEKYFAIEPAAKRLFETLSAV